MKKYGHIFIAIFALLLFSCSKESPKPIEDEVGNPPEEPGKPGFFINLGSQLTATSIQESTFAQDEAGNEYAYAVVSGKPGHLICFDMQTSKVIADMEITGADGSVAMALSTDKWLYVAGSNARLYRTRPGSSTLEDLGAVLPGQTMISDLVAGKDGEVFGGTYPGGRVFRYHPTNGFSDVGNGAIVAGESYVRSLAYQASGHKLFAGIGSHARLVEIDLETKAKKEMLPSRFWDQEFVYYMGIVSGYQDGDRLLAWFTSDKQRITFVYNLNSGESEQELGTIDAYSAIKSPNSNLSYYTAGNKLYSQDFSNPSSAPTLITDCYDAK